MKTIARAKVIEVIDYFRSQAQMKNSVAFDLLAPAHQRLMSLKQADAYEFVIMLMHRALPTGSKKTVRAEALNEVMGMTQDVWKAAVQRQTYSPEAEQTALAYKVCIDKLRELLG